MLKAPQFKRPDALNEYASIVIGGEPGTGKTHFLGTTKAIVIDTERGATTYNSPNFRADDTATPPDVVPVSFDPNKQASQYIYEVEQVIDWMIGTRNSSGYSVFAIDGITELQELFINSHPAKDPRQSYGDWANSLRRLILKSKNIPAHFLVTCRLDVKEDPISNLDMVRPALSPTSWKAVEALFDVIARLEVQVSGPKVTRYFDASPSARFKTKDRYGIGRVPNPTWPAIQQRIEAAYAASKAA